MNPYFLYPYSSGNRNPLFCFYRFDYHRQIYSVSHKAELRVSETIFSFARNTGGKENHLQFIPLAESVSLCLYNRQPGWRLDECCATTSLLCGVLLASLQRCNLLFQNPTETSAIYSRYAQMELTLLPLPWIIITNLRHGNSTTFDINLPAQTNCSDKRGGKRENHRPSIPGGCIVVFVSNSPGIMSVCFP